MTDDSDSSRLFLRMLRSNKSVRRNYAIRRSEMSDGKLTPIEIMNLIESGGTTKTVDVVEDIITRFRLDMLAVVATMSTPDQRSKADQEQGLLKKLSGVIKRQR